MTRFNTLLFLSIPLFLPLSLSLALSLTHPRSTEEETDEPDTAATPPTPIPTPTPTPAPTPTLRIISNEEFINSVLLGACGLVGEDGLVYDVTHSACWVFIG